MERRRSDSLPHLDVPTESEPQSPESPAETPKGETNFLQPPDEKVVFFISSTEKINVREDSTDTPLQEKPAPSTFPYAKKSLRFDLPTDSMPRIPQLVLERPPSPKDLELLMAEEVSQLRHEHGIHRENTSVTIPDVVAYTQNHITDDPLVTGFKGRKNPWKKKRRCSIL